MCKEPDKQSYSHFPELSEVYYAYKRGVSMYCLGTANNRVHGSSLKSGVRPTIFKEEPIVQELEREFCGKNNAFEKPLFKGQMQGSYWNSPWQNSLMCVKRETPDHMYMFLAVLDYISVLPDLYRDWETNNLS